VGYVICSALSHVMQLNTANAIPTVGSNGLFRTSSMDDYHDLTVHV